MRTGRHSKPTPRRSQRQPRHHERLATSARPVTGRSRHAPATDDRGRYRARARKSSPPAYSRCRNPAHPAASCSRYRLPIVLNIVVVSHQNRRYPAQYPESCRPSRAGPANNHSQRVIVRTMPSVYADPGKAAGALRPLSHRSWVGCHELFGGPSADELASMVKSGTASRVGFIKPAARRNILAAIECSPTIVDRQKERCLVAIQARLSRQADDPDAE